MKLHLAPLSLASLLALGSPIWADGPKDNLPSSVRPIPPPGIEIPAGDREALAKGAAELQAAIEDAKKAQAKNPRLADLLPDVEIFHKSVDWALRDNQFYNAREVSAAREQLAEGRRRAAALKAGDPYWIRQKGLVVRAYRSKIDGSVQPYGLVIPESYQGAPIRLDFWIHGRGETLSELAFVDQRMKQAGQIQPRDAIVLHPYGRYCCANKFAGEVDLFEALEHARRFYQIDEDRIIMRGFSMGGAAAWQFGAHFASRWCALNPGAGFAETPEFLNVFQNEDVSRIPDYQKTLWHLYNATDYALNLLNVPTIAYSGEIDRQKQAADVMAREMKKEGLDLVHIIGPQTAHKIHPDSLAEIERRLADISALGRNRVPREVHFTTWTLRYNEMAWVRIDGMEEGWRRARVDAVLKDDAGVEVRAENVTGLTLSLPPGQTLLNPLKEVRVTINGTTVQGGRPGSDWSWRFTWSAHSETAGLAKRHGLQGPIDDAFLDAFLFVTPSGPPLNSAVEKWVGSELPRAVREWRRQFRGDAPQRRDTEITDDDIAKNNLVLWGDPSSNAVLKRIAPQLPIRWSQDGIALPNRKFGADQQVLLLVFPNPLNPRRYVVLNSGFTYREYDYLNNARQVPKLPDWAIVNLSEPPNAISPGKILEAGFFDESWKIKNVSN